MRTAKRRGFTLVELMIVVAIVGVLAALASYGVNRYIAAARSSEAKEGVGAISRGAVMAFERQRAPSEIQNEGAAGAAASLFVLCTSANPVPASLAQIQGTKYQPTTTVGNDFFLGTAFAGWPCLGWSRTTEPISYRYQYIANGVGAYVSVPLGGPDPTSTGFEASAQGDLDGDGPAVANISTFARSGKIVGGTSLLLATQVFIDNEFE